MWKIESSSYILCIAFEYLVKYHRNLARLCISKMNLHVKYTHLMQIVFLHGFALTNSSKVLWFSSYSTDLHIISLWLYWFKAARNYTHLNWKPHEGQKRLSTVPLPKYSPKLAEN